MDKALRHRINAARVAVRNQTGLFNELFGQVTSDWKADETRVTFADFAISEKLFTELRRSFSGDQFLSEEALPPDETVPLESKYLWVLDPVDGTNNYALGMPSCSISLALFKAGKPVYGFIYDGSANQLIEGGAGQPLLVDGRKTSARGPSFEKRSAIVALHFPLPEGRSRDFRALLEGYRVRSLGSAALHLAYAALGRLDGAFDERVRLWDIAAGYCLIQATGREIRFLDGDPFPLEELSTRGPFLRYMAGDQAFLEQMENWLG